MSTDDDWVSQFDGLAADLAATSIASIPAPSAADSAVPSMPQPSVLGTSGGGGGGGGGGDETCSSCVGDQQ